MNPRDFTRLASDLATKGGSAECRSAISRAYYGVYNVATQFLELMGIQRPKQTYHLTLQYRLRASGDVEIEQLGDDLGDLCQRRNHADYKMDDKPSENLN